MPLLRSRTARIIVLALAAFASAEVGAWAGGSHGGYPTVRIASPGANLPTAAMKLTPPRRDDDG